MLPVKPQNFIIHKSLKREQEKSGVARGDFTAVTNRMHQQTKRNVKARMPLECNTQEGYIYVHKC
jgi:hypothetical protein